MKHKKTLYIAGGVIVILIALSFTLFNKSENGGEYIEAQKRDLKEVVRIAGTVEADTVSELGFEVSGTIKELFVHEGDQVYKGQALAQIGLGTLPAELQKAEADLEIKTLEARNTETSLVVVQKEQDTLVQNAYRKLLSNGLVATAQTETVTATPPTITGLYTGDSEGEYRMRVREINLSGNYELLVFGLETTKEVRIDKNKPVAIGTHGLFATFPDALSNYKDTVWTITLPNKESSSYPANYTAYTEALETREKALEDARAQLNTLSTDTTIANAELKKARAEVARIQAEIEKRIIRAPFTGTVATIYKDIGESVSANERTISIISEGEFGIEVDFPEIDVSKIEKGDKAIIEIDALENKTFEGVVTFVNRVETIVDGVSVYEGRIEFSQPYDIIASGMTADVEITTQERIDVLAIPIRAVTKEANTYTVQVIHGDIKETREVQTGLISSDSFIEITGGLEEEEVLFVGK